MAVSAPLSQIQLRCTQGNRLEGPFKFQYTDRMKIKNTVDEIIKTRTYTIEHLDHGTLVYVDYYNKKGKVIDSRLQTEEGFAIEVPALFEEVQEFIDTEGDVEGLSA